MSTSNFVCGICGKMRDVHSLTEIQVCWESSNNQAREAREGIRAAHNQLDAYNVPRETVDWQGSIQNVKSHPVWERVQMLATAWATERVNVRKLLLTAADQLEEHNSEYHHQTPKEFIEKLRSTLDA